MYDTRRQCAVERDADRSNKVITDCHITDYIYTTDLASVQRVGSGQIVGYSSYDTESADTSVHSTPLYCAIDKRLLRHRSAPVGSQQRLLYASFASDGTADEQRRDRVHRLTFRGP